MGLDLLLQSRVEMVDFLGPLDLEEELLVVLDLRERVIWRRWGRWKAMRTYIMNENFLQPPYYTYLSAADPKNYALNLATIYKFI